MGANSSTANINEKQKARHRREHRHRGGHDQVRGRRQPVVETAKATRVEPIPPPDLVRTVAEERAVTPHGSPRGGSPRGGSPKGGSPRMGSPHVGARGGVAGVHTNDNSKTRDDVMAADTTQIEYKWSPINEPKNRASPKPQQQEEEIQKLPKTPPPREGEYDMSTIRHAGVNVRNRISWFKENNMTPIIIPSEKNRRPITGLIKTSQSSHDQQSPTQTQYEDKPMRSHLEDQPRKTDGSSLPHFTEETNSKSTPKHESSRVSVLPPLSIKTSVQRNDGADESKLEEPAIDYNLNSPIGKQDANEETVSGNKPDFERMNTLEYFSQVPRESGLLKGFEKAKPAGLHKRAKPNRRGGAAARPLSMYPTTEASQYASNPDVRRFMVASTESLHQESREESTTATEKTKEEKLGTINRRGQKYAMDDTSYETLSRKKKIAGQQLAVGIVDEQTERSFLQSLKRNIQLKQARAAERSACRVDNQGETNRVNLTELVF